MNNIGIKPEKSTKKLIHEETKNVYDCENICNFLNLNFWTKKNINLRGKKITSRFEY